MNNDTQPFDFCGANGSTLLLLNWFIILWRRSCSSYIFSIFLLSSFMSFIVSSQGTGGDDNIIKAFSTYIGIRQFLIEFWYDSYHRWITILSHLIFVVQMGPRCCFLIGLSSYEEEVVVAIFNIVTVLFYVFYCIILNIGR